MNQPAPANPAGQHDERLAQLFEEVSRQQREGQRPDWEAIAREAPELVDELRQLFHLAQLAEQFGGSANHQPAEPATVAETRAAAPAGSGAFAKLPSTFGDYELLAELGRGAMGVVYKAWEPSLRRHVALKMMLQGEGASALDLARFRGEAQSAAGLSHPHIVPVYNVGEQGGRVYFSMKYVEGTTLSALLADGPLPPREAAGLLAAISRAVHHAHDNGVLHRDLKPSNVMIDKDGQPLVTDFGLAKRVEGGASLTGTGAIVGTPSYMAPEQAAAQGAPTRASDVYSLGAMLYELLTGRPPFQAASVWDVLLLVRTEEPVPPRRLNPKIDPDLELICLKCLEKRPEHRYATAGDLAKDLEAFLNSEPVSARVSSLTYFVTRILRETHHAPVLENWGKLWLWHSVKIFLLCAVTNLLFVLEVQDRLPYLGLWGVGLVAWAFIFWFWRRSEGPVTFVERQMAHAWAAGVAASVGLFIVEWLLALPVLTLSPLLAVIAGMVFLFKAGTLSGSTSPRFCRLRRRYRWRSYRASASCSLASSPPSGFLCRDGSTTGSGGVMLLPRESPPRLATA